MNEHRSSKPNLLFIYTDHSIIGLRGIAAASEPDRRWIHAVAGSYKRIRSTGGVAQAGSVHAPKKSETAGLK